MDQGEYRERARRCRHAAADCPEPVRSDFLWAAEQWELLADQLERLARLADPHDPPGESAPRS